MSDFAAIFLVLVALATAGNFANVGGPGVGGVGGSCKGQFIQVCW